MKMANEANEDGQERRGERKKADERMRDELDDEYEEAFRI